MITNQIPDDA